MNIAIAVLLVLQLSATRAECDLTRRQMMPIFSDLYEASHTAAKDTERALFLTRDDAGNLDYKLWPATQQRRKASYRGPVPPNTVAIAHTHPHGMPKPSQHDINEAARTGLPIYVITRTSIARVDPDRTTKELVRRDWVGGDVATEACEMWG
ncbi:MAG TPA: Mov34/MPN/PAD-1 family protein [Thermoanaerobaculia bacterium]